MNRLLLCTFMLVSKVAFAGSIWEPATTCKTKQFGVWYNCPNLPETQSIEFAADRVSTTDSEFIKSLPILNQISYSTYCKASRSLDFGLAFNGRTIPLGWNTANSIQNSLSYSEQDNKYALKITVPTSSTGVMDPCQIEILTNSSKVSDRPMRVYANSMIKSATRLNRIVKDIAELETLGSGWANLQSVAEDLELEIILLQADLDTYPKDSTEYTAANGRKKFYEDIKSYVTDGLSVAAACEDETSSEDTKALCLVKAKALSTVAKGYRDDSVTELKSIKGFMEGEKVRLAALDAAYAEQLGQIIDLITRVTK